MAERQLEQASVVADLARGDQIRALLRLVLRVDVGAGLDQRTGRVEVIAVGGGDEGGGVDVGAFFEKRPHSVGVTGTSRCDQRTIASRRTGVLLTTAARAQGEHEDEECEDRRHEQSSTRTARPGADEPLRDGRGRGLRLAEPLRELLDEAVGEVVRHVQDVAVDLVVGGDVRGPVALQASHCFLGRQLQMHLHFGLQH